MNKPSTDGDMWNLTAGPQVVLSSILAMLCLSCSGIGTSDPAALVAELDAKIPKVVESGNAPSVQVAVISRDQVVWSEAFGENTSVEHVYMNGSVQKVLTATAVLQLVEKGLVALDADASDYVPFEVRHPGYPQTPITVWMLLAHRSGLNEFPHQFAWDTESTFSPQYRPACPEDLQVMMPGEFLDASFAPGGANYDERAWIGKPGRQYRYSVSAYPFLRYLVGQVSGQSYEDYMQENIFSPLEMSSSGFSVEEFEERHAIPYTRLNGGNIELPPWSGNGSMMHTTAADLANFQIALMHNGRYGSYQLLQPETVDMMRRPTTRFKALFKSSDDLLRTGHGLGLFSFKAGWLGFGGSVPGYQCLMRYHPTKQAGYVILSNVNAILTGGENYKSARSDIYESQDALVSILDPTYGIRFRTVEILIICGLVAYFTTVGIFISRRRARKKNAKAS